MAEKTVPAPGAQPARNGNSKGSHSRSLPGAATPAGRVLSEIAAAHDATPRQVALRFLTRRSSVFTIPKASSPEHVSENAGAGHLRLTKDEIALIDTAFPVSARRHHLPTI